MREPTPRGPILSALSYLFLNLRFSFVLRFLFDFRFPFVFRLPFVFHLPFDLRAPFRLRPRPPLRDSLPVGSSPVRSSRSLRFDLEPPLPFPFAFAIPIYLVLVLVLILVPSAWPAMPPVGTGTLQAQVAEGRPLWFADLRYERDAFRGDSPVWTDWWAVRGSVYREFDRGTIGIEGGLDRRFGQTDESITVDGYRDFWDGAYGNLRVRVAPGADVLPRSDFRGEIFQAFGGPWEGSAHLWFMNAAGTDVTLGGMGLARYAGSWYLRATGSVVSSGGRETGSGRVAARRFIGGSRQYIELTTGGGGEVVTLGPGPELDVRDTWFVQVTAQRYFWVMGPSVTDPDSEIGSERLLGAQLSGGLHEFEGIPRRRRLSLGLIVSF